LVGMTHSLYTTPSGFVQHSHKVLPAAIRDGVQDCRLHSTCLRLCTYMMPVSQLPKLTVAFLCVWLPMPLRPCRADRALLQQPQQPAVAHPHYNRHRAP
jgi:hypothetical protein